MWRPVACVQNFSEFVPVAPESDPFPFATWSKILRDTVPTFVDWDGDGDVDFLRIAEEIDNSLILLEQLPDARWVSHTLPVPRARDFAVGDFDGDGDIDLVIAAYEQYHCRYFERRADGGLAEIVDRDNPFGAFCGLVDGILSSPFSTIAMGDWNMDGEMDMLRVERSKVTLWINSPMDEFIEQTGKNNPLPDDDLPSDVSLVDVDADGDLDLVLTTKFAIGKSVWTYLEHRPNGKLFKHPSTNRFTQVPVAHEDSGGSKSMTTVADVDGDGLLDVVYPNLEYAKQHSNGSFSLLTGPDNPFHNVPTNSDCCWTLVDWDKDGDLDLVQFYRNDSRLDTLDDAVEMLTEHFQHMHLYEQANGSFSEIEGAASPFYSMNFRPPPESMFVCPALFDFDGDGNLELALVDSKGSFFYFVNEGGNFTLAPSSPFGNVRIEPPARELHHLRPVHIWLVDWDGDGLDDLVVRTKTRMQYFRRGACAPLPTNSFCKFGSCNQKTSQCKCVSGAMGQECGICDMYHFRTEDACGKCPGYGTKAGACSRRGVCNDDAGLLWIKLL